MSTHDIITCLPMLALLLVAAANDVRERLIRNWLTLGLMLSGLMLSMLGRTSVDPWDSLAGMGTGFGLTFLLFGLSALGGGDVKLLTAVGAWVGAPAVFQIFLAAAIGGMLIVLIQAAATGRVRVLLRNSAVVAMNLAHINEVGVDHVSETGKECRSVDRPLPYAVPVLMATVFILWVNWNTGGAS